jgi:hypothetical protein
VLALDLEDLAELLFHQVALVQGPVAGGDSGQRGPLPGGEIFRFLPGGLLRPPVDLQANALLRI